MQRKAPVFIGLFLAVVIGWGAAQAIGGVDNPEIGDLTPVAPQGSSEQISDPLFIDGEPVTPFDDDDDAIAIEGSEMPVPGVDDVDETVVEAGSGMVVPGFEDAVDDMIVETNP